MHDLKAEKSVKADLLMAIELFNDIVAVGRMADLSEKICEQLRELCGARTVMLIKHEEPACRYTIAGVSPARRANILSSDELQLFCPKKVAGALCGHVKDFEDKALGDMLAKKCVETVLMAPLRINLEIIGCVVLFDFPDEERMHEIAEIIHFLSTSLALSVKNAIDRELIANQAGELKALNEQLETRVQDRTRELEQSEEKYRVLFESSAEGILVVNPSTMRFVFANPTACQMFGYSEPEFQRMSVPDIHPIEAHEKVKEEFSRLVSREKFYTTSIKCLRSDKAIFLADIKASKVILNGMEHLVGFFTDITERKQHEENLQRAARLESLGILAGGIAHDFNNLLGGIFGYIELSMDTVYDAMALKFLSTAMGTIDRARDLTRQLLTFSKGGSPARKSENVEKLLREMVQFSLSGSNVTCSFIFAKDLSDGNLDRNQIGQVVDNLVINARQAMPDGGTIVVTAANCQIIPEQHSLLHAGNYVKIEFSDNGPGISEAMQKKIFDPFFTTKDLGHGLGLAVCYSILQQHEGCIEVFSRVGEGTIFTLYIPAIVASDDEGCSHNKELKHMTGNVLIMDDEEVVRNIMALMLENLGLKCVAFANGKDALAWLEKNDRTCDSFVCMFFDLTVPGGMGGLELTRELRGQGASLPIFVTSGYAEDPVMASPEKFGFNGSIRKPFVIAELSALLENFVARKNIAKKLNHSY